MLHGLPRADKSSDEVGRRSNLDNACIVNSVCARVSMFLPAKFMVPAVTVGFPSLA